MEIEKNIPAPKRRKYPFAEMDVGDSILVLGEEGRKAANAARVYGHLNGIKFATRQRDGGVRIWRVE